ncbi:unnamed protein product [Staurois parvus]|uniref:Uncharacterized protein n=1 Tax=Staurois parvus TaxID=386267 RepID=A0ABN9D4J9_9NEOB|nr:unnamed protein product [Staurois parvus]
MLTWVRGAVRLVQQKLVCNIPRRGISQNQPLRMRFVQFQTATSAGQRIGVELDGEKIIDLNSFDSSLPPTMREFLEAGDVAFQTAKRALDSGQHILSRDGLTILAPITNPDKVVCVGMNYWTTAWSRMFLFLKSPSSSASSPAQSSARMTLLSFRLKARKWTGRLN